jgi:regulatory protein
MFPDELLQKALNFSYFYLKFRPRTKKEVEDYLNKKAKKYFFTPEIIEKALLELEEKKFINDREFVTWFIEQRNNGKPKGQPVLTGELLRLGINKDLIDEYFSINEVDELSLAKQALQKKPSLTDYQKAFNFLLRRGFGYEVIKITLKEMQLQMTR